LASGVLSKSAMKPILVYAILATFAAILAALLGLYRSRARLLRSRQIQERLIDWNHKDVN
jgi:integral membrane sensor domain MASE1